MESTAHKTKQFEGCRAKNEGDVENQAKHKTEWGRDEARGRAA